MCVCFFFSGCYVSMVLLFLFPTYKGVHVVILRYRMTAIHIMIWYTSRHDFMRCLGKSGYVMINDVPIFQRL